MEATKPGSREVYVQFCDYTILHTESQHGRGWKGPLWVIQSNPLPKQGHPEQAAQDLVQAGLEYLQRRRLHSLPEQPVPVLRHPQSEEVLPQLLISSSSSSYARLNEVLPLSCSVNQGFCWWASCGIPATFSSHKKIPSSIWDVDIHSAGVCYPGLIFLLTKKMDMHHWLVSRC